MIAPKRICLTIPIYNEAENLPDVLRSIERQTIDRDRLYVIAVDGASSDGSAQIVARWLAAADIAGEVLLNPRRAIAASLNLAFARCTSADLIVRLDSHTVYGENYVRDIVRAFDTAPADVACVGGPQIPEPARDFERAVVAALLTNPVGLGGADFRRAREPKYVDSAYLGAWRPGVMQAIGGFDEAWSANEDSELNARLRERGMRTWWWPLESRYRVNRTAAQTIRQWGRYGFWRAKTSLMHPGHLRLRHCVPTLALLSAIVMSTRPELRIALAICYGAYAIAVLRNRARNERFAVSLACCVFFPAAQIAYALGFFIGITRGLAKKSLLWMARAL